jgi:hypothetical protein
MHLSPRQTNRAKPIPNLRSHRCAYYNGRIDERTTFLGIYCRNSTIIALFVLFAAESAIRTNQNPISVVMGDIDNDTDMDPGCC